MPKVICTLRNASNEINGVKFEEHEGRLLSEEISEDMAAKFAAIPGYELMVEEEKPKATAKAAAPAKAAPKVDAPVAPVAPIDAGSVDVDPAPAK